jgi:hypothetical protein
MVITNIRVGIRLMDHVPVPQENPAELSTPAVIRYSCHIKMLHRTVHRGWWDEKPPTLQPMVTLNMSILPFQHSF